MENNSYTVGASINAFTIKIIAYITMIIDHLGALVVPKILEKYGINPQESMLVYTMRFIGRISFPLFAFMIAEGMNRTSKRRNYILRLLTFALLSEIPFNLARTCSVWDKTYQNVMVSLFLSACLIVIWDTIETRIKKYNLGIIFKVVTLLIILAGTILLLGDYRVCAPLLVLCFYKLLGNPAVMYPVSIAILLLGNAADYSLQCFYPVFKPDTFSFQYIISLLQMEIPSVLALPIIYSYNGEKGRELPKLFYYLIYPVHLLIIYFIVLSVQG